MRRYSTKLLMASSVFGPVGELARKTFLTADGRRTRRGNKNTNCTTRASGRWPGSLPERQPERALLAGARAATLSRRQRSFFLLLSVISESSVVNNRRIRVQITGAFRNAPPTCPLDPRTGTIAFPARFSSCHAQRHCRRLDVAKASPAQRFGESSRARGKHSLTSDSSMLREQVTDEESTARSGVVPSASSSRTCRIVSPAAE